MTTIRETKQTEEQWLQQMRRDAVENYKKELSELIDSRIEEQMPEDNDLDYLVKYDPRKAGIIRGLTSAKEIINSHIINIL